MNSFKISTKFSLSKYPSKIFTFTKFKYLFNLKKKRKLRSGKEEEEEDKKFLVPRINKISLFLKYSNFLPQQNVLNSNILQSLLSFVGRRKEGRRKLKQTMKKKEKNKQKEKKKKNRSFFPFFPSSPQTPPHFVLLCYFYYNSVISKLQLIRFIS